MLRKLIAAWARPRVLPEDARERLLAKPSFLCYVIEMRGIADSVVAQQACEKLALPAANKSAPQRALTAAGISGFPLFYLERRTGFLGDRIDRRIPTALRQLVRTAANDPAIDIAFVPISIFWGRAPAKEDSWLRLWLSETWDLAGRFRRFMSVVVNGRNLLVQIGDPVPLHSLAGPNIEPARLVRRLARRMRLE